MRVSAAAGINGTVGHPGGGAAVGRVLPLGTGALIGDQNQALQERESDLEKQLKSSQSELEPPRKELSKTVRHTLQLDR